MTEIPQSEKVPCINIKSSFSVLFMGNKEAAVKKEIQNTKPFINWGSYEEIIMQLTGDLQPHLPLPRRTPTENKRLNTLSKKSQSRIKNYVNLLLATAIEKEIYSRKENKRFKYKIGFATVTIPPDFYLSDKEIHQTIFKPFIRVLQEKYDLSEYIWKAETQDNGRLHYHITINQWVHWFIINREWRKQIQKHGYNYGDEKRKRAATEIHSVHKVKNLGAYLCKYLSKNDVWKKSTPKEIIKKYEKMEWEKQPTDELKEEHAQYLKRVPDIKLWDCSMNLKKEKLTLRNIMDDHLPIMKDFTNLPVIEIIKDFFSLWIYDYDLMKQTKHIGKIWDDYITRIRMPDKQKPYYEIETMKYNDSKFTYN